MFYFLFNFIKEKVKSLLPSLYCILYDPRQKWTISRFVLSYLLGVILAIIFWKLFIENLNLSIGFTYGTLIVLIVVLGLGFVFTTAVKCVAFLAIFGLVGKSGRSFLRALCVAFIITGPITNLALNGEEIVRVFACTTILTYNLTKTRFDLMTRPFQNTLAAMKSEVTEIQHSFDSIEDIINPIKDEITGDFSDMNASAPSPLVERFVRQEIIPALSLADPTNATSRLAKAESYRRKYAQKMRARCKEQLRNGEERCKSAFLDAYRKCMQMLPMVVDILLCWPLKIDYVCNMQLIGYSENGGICDPGDNIDPTLGMHMLSLEETEFELFKNGSDVEIHYEFVKVKPPPQLKAAKDTAKAVYEEVHRKKRALDYVLGLIQNILSFVFLRIIYTSIGYHKNFLEKIEFDNVYITSYFKRIDARRKEAHLHSLLPLKKFERQFLVDVEHICHRTKEESAAVAFFLLRFCLELLISGFFLLLDHVLVVLMAIVAIKSEITYYQEGEHTINFHIDGTGLMARLLRKTLKNFDMNERIYTTMSNKSCLPKPSVLPRRFYVTLIGVYFASLVLIYFNSIALRCRRFTCSFFYRKREKQRVLHLYNKLLRQRRSIFEIMYRTVKHDVETQRLRMNWNLFLWLRSRFPRCFGWLRWFAIARKSCLICGELEPVDPDSESAIKFVECSTSSCDFIHCEECWIDVNEVCIACQREEVVLRCCGFEYKSLEDRD